MIIDSTEAREHWCPFGRRLYAGDDGSGAVINRHPDHKATDLSPCLGPTCMAWRWLSDLAPDHPRAANDGNGFCGIAGRPIQ